MRALLIAVLVSVMACAPDGVLDRCDLGRAVACTCSSGATGAQECGPSGVWSPCVCSTAGDAGAAVSDAPPDRPRDVARDADPRCSAQPSTTSWCEAADAGACVDLSTDARNCGACGHACSGGLECFGGFCFVRAPDAGR